MQKKCISQLKSGYNLHVMYQMKPLLFITVLFFSCNNNPKYIDTVSSASFYSYKINNLDVIINEVEEKLFVGESQPAILIRTIDYKQEQLIDPFFKIDTTFVKNDTIFLETKLSVWASYPKHIKKNRKGKWVITVLNEVISVQEIHN